MVTKYTHVGKLEKSEDGKFTLAAVNGGRFNVDQGVAAIWTSFDGKTIEEISHLFAGKNKPEDVQKAIQEIVTKLSDMGLLKPSE